MPKPLQFKTFRDMPLWAISQATTLYNKTGSWRNFRPVYDNKIPPCNDTCPAGEKIQGYIDLINQGRDSDAWTLLKQDNPFPAVCGRVCFHPCETKCNRDSYDQPVAIHCIERFIGDYGLSKKLKVTSKPARMTRSGGKVESGKKVAIIGGGPAGLSCAYFLALNGVRPTIFEATKDLGGMLMHGIPSYRLPKSILKKEIDSIIRLGVEVKTNAKIGKDIPLKKVYKKYKAIFIATGAWKERRLDIQGENSEGVIPALDFLYHLNAGRRVKLGKRVAIIGGGNAAIDAARSVLRLGAKPIIIYRRTRNEMPAIPDEIRDAEEEKIEFIFLAAPVKILTQQGKVRALECIRMKLGKPDRTGRRRPIPIKGSNFTVKIDTIIPAIGEMPETSYLSPLLKTDNNLLKVDQSGTTKLKKVFAGGDVVTGPRTLVEAIGAGKQAAVGIIQFLKTGKKKPLPVEKGHIVQFEEINLNYFEPAQRVAPIKLKPTQRQKGFKEVYQHYATKQAKEECERCFSCGVCNRCDNCFVFCPDMTVIKKNKHYEFNYDYCKGCGICVVECPRNAISLVEEKR